MKKNIFTSLLCLTLVSFVFVSCDKKDDDPPAPTKTELITSGSWSFDKAFSSSIDITANVPACYKDNIVSFTAAFNGSVVNTIVCTPTDITPPSFTWSFQSGETVLHLSAPLFAGGTGDFSLVSLTSTSLVVSQNVIIPPSSSATNVVFYYKH